MTVFETLILMINFAGLVTTILILSYTFSQKK